jgi:hypothetical protein
MESLEPKHRKRDERKLEMDGIPKTKENKKYDKIL